jgi:pimeloyl-ACP methyl ester carboxylesterase
MPIVAIDGIKTRYETSGSGPPILMFSPGGFNATLDNWSTLGIYARTRPLEHLSQRYTCITFDRREAGQSGGRFERLTWECYVAQAKGLLDHLGLARAHLMGGCLGCSSVVAFAVAYPQAVAGMVLYWPAGGPKYRLNSQQRFAQHLAFVQQKGLAEVVAAARESTKSFGADPRCGPWAATLRSDPAFAHDYAALDPDLYIRTVADMSRGLFDRDTVPGAEPEDLMELQIPALIIPGNDDSHATSAARYLGECLPKAEYWNVAVPEQTEAPTSGRLLEFLNSV